MKLDNQSMQFLTIFETLTKASVKDCYLNNNKLIFIVNPGNISKAVGANGKNVHRVERLLKKKIKVIEFNPDPVKFVRNYIFPIKPKSIEMEHNEIEIRAENSNEKGILIGRDKRNLINLKKTVNKYFKINDIKIL